MATEIVTGTSQFLITGDNEIYTLNDGSTISEDGDDAAIQIASGADNNKLILKGDVTQQDNANAAVDIDGANTEISITKTGSILGIGGIRVDGVNGSLINAGDITATGQYSHAIAFYGDNAVIRNTGNVLGSTNGGTALFSDSDYGHIYNNGTLEATTGISLNQARTTIELGADSVVTGGGAGAGIFAFGYEDDRVTITNNGTINGVEFFYAIQLTGDTNDKLANHGTINGEVVLGGGNDVFTNDKGKVFGEILLGDGNDLFDNRKGKVDNGIEGGAGDDTLITDKSSVKLLENTTSGYDTVKSTVGYTLSDNVESLVLMGKGNINGTGTDTDNDLIGNGGKNHLFGKAGFDTLDGGKGNDLLTGGDDADAFVFKKGYGRDTITDFSHEEGDKIDLSQWGGFDSFKDVKQHWSENHGDLVITLGGDQLVLKDTTKQDVSVTDFIL